MQVAAHPDTASVVADVLLTATEDPAAVTPYLQRVYSEHDVQPELITRRIAEMKAAVKPVMQALKHWVIEEARQADRCHREMPFMVEVDESAGAPGDRLEGDMDLVYRKDGVWTVVAYKTDEKLDELTDEYRVQVGWYLYAMHALTGEPVRGILLRV